MHEETSINLAKDEKLLAHSTFVMEFATHCNRSYTDKQLLLDSLKRAADMARISDKGSQKW